MRTFLLPLLISFLTFVSSLPSQATPFRLRLLDITFTPEVEDWEPTARLKKTYMPPEGRLEETIELKLTSEKELTRYSLEATSPFPLLDLSSQTSRGNFYSKLQDWARNLNLVPHTFRFDGTHEGMDFSIQQPHPYYSKPISLELHEILGRPFPEKKTFEINCLRVRVRSGSLDFSLDIRNKLPISSLTYPLPVTSSPVAPGAQHISVDGMGRVFQWEGHSLNYTNPRIAGFKETPDEDMQLTYLHPSSSANLYKNALAASVLLKEDLDTLPLYPQEAPQIHEAFEDMTVVSMSESVASSAFSSSHMSSTSSFSHALYSDKKTSEVYTLLGEETRVESPYLYSDGQFIFLTQTFRQECGDATLKQASQLLTYTKNLPFKVRILSNDLRLEASYRLPQGLYTLEDGLWAKIDDRYLRSTAYDDYKALSPKAEGLARSIASFEKAHYPGLSQAHELLGHLRDFIQPDPSTLEDDGLFQDYHRRIYSEGLLKTLTSIPEEHEHLITPLCLVVREDPTLNDPKLFRPESTHHNCHKMAKEHGVCWGSTLNTPKSYPTMNSFLCPQFGCGRLHLANVAFPSSLVALPLFKITQKPYLAQLEFSIGLWDEAQKIPVSTLLFEKEYRHLARYLDLNEALNCNFYYSSDYEPDDVLTISPFAQALARQKVLRRFLVPRGVGLMNLTCLFREGLCQNTSIKELSLSNLCGEMPILLLSEVISKNVTIEELKLKFYHFRDKEIFNILGRSLIRNTTLKVLELENSSELPSANCKNPYCRTRQLPERPVPLPVDLSPFINALISFKGSLTIGYPEGTFTAIKEPVQTGRDKLGFKTHIYPSTK